MHHSPGLTQLSAYAACHNPVPRFIHALEWAPRLPHGLLVAQIPRDSLALVSTSQHASERDAMRLPLLVTAAGEEGLTFAQTTVALVVGEIQLSVSNKTL